ncbi:stromal membrane-associated protein 1 isoform X2 [Arctopsyche grandis]|uniref:stromal membrane-associated protein 1 isoform X2 n=1 Tax=Arctopsyche grandis TaxID=121162 RepID=UPI00406D7127
MSSRSERDRSRQVQERCQRELTKLLKDDDNKYCVDCDAKGPRWASWNIGIFLCIRCAGIHRNLGVHISKVKSVNLDTWTPEQVVSLQQMGNSRARAVYEANLPDAFRRPQTDSALEAFIRAKYEHRKYVAREWVPPSPPQVNWDKEIDEEMEKQKKKKKSSSSTLSSNSIPTSEKKSNSSDVVPQLLPKPKSSASPKPGRSTPKRDSGGTADLLGTATKTPVEPTTQNSSTDDVFSSFLSAPQIPQDVKEVSDSKVSDLKSEEENFFNQPAPSEREKSKMTKDSILALYGQTPQNIGAQFSQQNSVFGTGFPQQSYPPPNPAFAQAFTNFSNQNAFMSNGTVPIANTMPQSYIGGFNQFPQPVGMPNTFNNQYPTNQNQFASLPNFSANLGNNSNQFQSTPQFQNANGAFPTNSTNGSQSFFGAQTGNNMTQQFGGMSLGQNAQPMNAFPPTQNNMPSLPGKPQPNTAWP